MTMAHALCPRRNSKGANAIYLLPLPLPVATISDTDSLKTVHSTHDLTFTFESKAAKGVLKPVFLVLN